MYPGAGLPVTRTPPSSPSLPSCMHYPPPLPCPPSHPSLNPLPTPDGQTCAVHLQPSDQSGSLSPPAPPVQGVSHPPPLPPPLPPPPPPPPACPGLPPPPPPPPPAFPGLPPPPPPPLSELLTPSSSKLAAARKLSTSRKKAITPGKFS